MRPDERFLTLQQTWVIQAAHELSNFEGIQQSFQHELVIFFNLLYESLHNHNPQLLHPILERWSQSLTQSDLADQSTTVMQVCGQLFSITFKVCSEELGKDDSLALWASLQPIEIDCLAYASQLEKQREIEHIQQEMERMKFDLETLDRSKSDFISVAAHELKTPLTLIEGYAAMLRETAAEQIAGEQVNRLLNGMDQGADRLKRIIDDMIDISLIDNHLLTLNFQPMWIDRMISILADEFASAMQLRRQKLVFERFDGANDLIFADSERIYQALKNLLSNAIKFTPDGGQVTIGGRKLPGFLELTFHDTGIGIAQEDIGRIFEKFSRAGNSALHSSGNIKFKGGGPGLGLPITRGIIEAHGGALWVESDGYDEVKYPGSTFHVLLPARKEPPDAQIAKLLKPLYNPDKGT